ncbi:hypothetical protein [Caballeronia choica]|jgi:hypothetical protein|uniref:hypothetical protein n=1 Tax=Caballeronia choica TaxID=326476 RepID=UPI001F1FA9C8|nr:hypothetical protein [Caballeronia choica]
MGSSSFGLSVTGFGATAGTTRVDEACVRRLDAREFRAMGLTDVALSLLCQSEDNRRAVEATGHLCPGTKAPLAKVKSTAETASVTDDDKYRDPIVRARLGLPVANAKDSTPESGPQTKDRDKPTQDTKPIQEMTPIHAQMADARPSVEMKPITPPQIVDAKPPVVKSPAVENADTLEQKIMKYGWNPVNRKAAEPVKPDGLVAAVMK